MFRSGGSGSKGFANYYLVHAPGLEDQRTSLSEQALSMSMAMNADNISQAGDEMLGGLLISKKARVSLI